MYSPLHAAAGVAIMAAVPNPFLGVPLAILSHYVLDTVPHGDMRKPPHILRISEGQRLALTELFDLPLAALTVWKLSFIFPHLDPAFIIAGAIAGILPDLLWGGKFLLEKLRWNIPGLMWLLNRHHDWHEGVHVKADHDIPFWAGVGYHLVVIGLLCFAG